MKAVALIPARYDSVRFPGKLLKKINGKSVIARTYTSAMETGLFSEVVIVTDSDKIREEIEGLGGTVVMSERKHECGTDRIAEAVATLDGDVFVNVQGDEPFVQKEPLEKLLNVFDGPVGAKIQVASLVQKIKDESHINDPNYVKVVLDMRMFAMYFSRSPIPYIRDNAPGFSYYEHIGVYAFRKLPLMEFAQWPQSPMERAEKIECLRFLENSVPIKMVMTPYMGVQIDVPEDIDKAEAYIKEMRLELE